MKGSKKKMKVLKKVLKILLFMSVMLAAEGKELRIMTYNIYGGRLANGIKLGESIKSISLTLFPYRKLIKIQKEVILGMLLLI